jgi:hypothetical protein
MGRMGTGWKYPGNILNFIISLLMKNREWIYVSESYLRK